MRASHLREPQTVFPWNTRVLLCTGSQLYSQIDRWSLVIGGLNFIIFHPQCCTYSYMKYCVETLSEPFDLAQGERSSH
jgi:hypothetical protein